MSAPAAMEVDAQPKRLLVNIDDPSKSVPEARRNQYQVNPTLKSSVVQALIHAHTQLCKAFTLSEAELLNISLTTQVTSVLCTPHLILRQSSNATGKLGDKIGENYFIHKGQQSVTVKKIDVHELVTKVFETYGLRYSDQPFLAPWLGMIAPYLTFMSCFKHRMDEVRSGVGKFPIGMSGINTLMADLTQFGLNSSHHIHCEGITYPPMKRSSIAQSVGPMTQLIMLNQSRKNPRFSDKWKRACARSLAHFPQSQAILDYVFSHDASTIAPYLSLIADILTITGSRASIKAFFPYSILFGSIKEGVRHQMYAAPVSAQAGAIPTYTPVVIENSANWDHSGIGAFVIYNAASLLQYSMNLAGSADIAGQVVFHSIWGSHLEDLQILHFMTGWLYVRHQAGARQLFQTEGFHRSLCALQSACHPQLCQALSSVAHR